MMPGGRAIQPDQRLGRTGMGDQPLSDVAGKVLRPAASLDRSDVGIDIALQVRQLAQPARHHETPTPLPNIVPPGRLRQGSKTRLQQAAQLRPPLRTECRT